MRPLVECREEDSILDAELLPPIQDLHSKYGERWRERELERERERKGERERALSFPFTWQVEAFVEFEWTC